MSTTTTSGMRLKTTRKWKLFANLAIDSANPSELLKPFHWRTPSLTEIDGDLFHPGVPFKFVDKVMAVMALNPHITFQVLTKRPERMSEYFGQNRSLVSSVEPLAHLFAMEFGPALPSRFERFKMDHAKVFANLLEEVTTPLPNLWIGTSVENQATADERIPHLLKIPAAVRVLSCEPLLGPVSLSTPLFRYSDGRGMFTYLGKGNYSTLIDAVDWVIAGGESGPNARPMHPDWARSLRDQCQAAKVPFLFKQVGEWTCYEESATHFQNAYTGAHVDPHTFPSDLTTRGDDDPSWLWSIGDEYGNLGPATVWHRVGKARAGRILDGREWNAFPEVSNG